MADPIDFDYSGAVKAGYSPEEIQSYLKTSQGVDFDIPAAKKAGYSDDEISGYLTNLKKKGSSAVGGTSGQGLDVSSISNNTPNKDILDYNIPVTPTEDNTQKKPANKVAQQDLSDNAIAGQGTNAKVNSINKSVNDLIGNTNMYDKGKTDPYGNPIDANGDAKAQKNADSYLNALKTAKGSDGKPLLNDEEFNSVANHFKAAQEAKPVIRSLGAVLYDANNGTKPLSPDAYKQYATELSNQYLKIGNNEAALNLNKALHVKFPDDAEPVTNVAKIQLGANDLKAANKTADAAIKLGTAKADDINSTIDTLTNPENTKPDLVSDGQGHFVPPQLNQPLQGQPAPPTLLEQIGKAKINGNTLADAYRVKVAVAQKQGNITSQRDAAKGVYEASNTGIPSSYEGLSPDKIKDYGIQAYSNNFEAAMNWIDKSPYSPAKVAHDALLSIGNAALVQPSNAIVNGSVDAIKGLIDLGISLNSRMYGQESKNIWSGLQQT